VVRRAMLLRDSSKIEPSVIGFEQEPEPVLTDAAAVPAELPEGLTLEQTLEQLERRIVETALRRHDFHKDRTAKALGLSCSALFRRLKQWGYAQEDEEKN
jgi:DNA-binding NtrC family response regulator